jgi:alpha-mannosidase
MAMVPILLFCVVGMVGVLALPVQIHLIPHSHCDAGISWDDCSLLMSLGWLKTFEGYYSSEVSKILPSIIDSMVKDPTLRFNWAETGFLRRWWQDATELQKEQFHTLVRTNRIIFVGGGWVQNDESVTARDAMIEQVAIGHAWLLDVFNKTPRIAWQIDPFGHSISHALVVAEAGYDAIVLDRVGWNTKFQLGQDKHLEFVWQPLPSKSSRILAHVLDVPLQLYASPVDFDFESDPHANPAVTRENLQRRALDLLAQVTARRNLFRSSDVLIPFGMDFRYQHAAWVRMYHDRSLEVKMLSLEYILRRATFI